MQIDIQEPMYEHEIEDSRPNVGGNTVNDEEVHGEDEPVFRFLTSNLAFTEEDTVFEPYKGMEFESHEEAYAFYEEYASYLGFTAKKRNTRRSRRTGTFIDANFACYRQGTKHTKQGVINPRPTNKTDCKASMHVKRRQDGKWYVHNFIKEHNHELLPAQAYHFRSRRCMNAISKKHLEFLCAGQVQTSNICNAMSNECNGDKSVCYPKKDVRNHIDIKACLAIKQDDIQALLDYFIHMQQENPNFFYVVDLNDEQRLRNVFWVDAKGRHDYFSFGDVVYFDTTYLERRYDLPFAPFIGVNNHLEPILLGCALLADVTESTFVWLMQTWLRAMGGVAPRMIVTNQDKALKESVAEIFPYACHQYCLWHVLMNIHEKLSHVIKRNENFMEEFTRCTYKSWTEEEFETAWWKMVDYFQLREDDWIRSLYDDRKHWVPVYMKGTSAVGISTTNRSDSIISFFDTCVHQKTTLKEFLTQCKVILQDRHDKESGADSETWHEMPPLKSHSPYEKQMSTIYTYKIFRKFQEEVLGTVACHPKKEKEDGTHIIFRVHDFEAQEEFTVTWNKTKLEVSCLCRLFEYKGFLCRHAMVVLQFSALTEIPSTYILERWTRDAKNRYRTRQRSEELGSRAQRCNDLCQRALKLGIEGSISQESYTIAVFAIEEAIRKCAVVNNPVKFSVNPSTSVTWDGFGTEQTMQ
ncbi:PREDICTED: protein FAR-RED IMPAIRED RESPONSE 1-like [Nelumbo nucifera]|uniref:Protein FAR1-RELATED SEQUENCE n=2 Tax=Nelumbo nucifera TaxID=4432 RepID=A0A1U8B1N8_NELNU|nr:PREDICTED: protein FAR-RED IMPAIRED RESPONSE 1-like [Nelumbo nucifera]XP_010274578.1 PREDICTED: protein FAR-RED IMPAIRED RESPONSE 1-like [Nelumbo nucifera]XP_010274580.1 PREDICTED: protein FAR-RED IMPAIRED RESPONSE 1-like [Nelumbo nucifera]DAD18246.1 TPA_asm: hypothetical protein HUJ06_019709 [Nelumbo nucifera]